MKNEPIAIVGAACHYPDAPDPNQLWENILAGRRAFRRLPDCRLNLDDYLADDPNHPDTTYAAQAALLTDYEFDRGRFRVVGSTFRSADMAHWLALDVAARAFADAGFPDAQGLPKDAVGVLVGNSLTGEFSRAGIMRLRWPYVRRTVDAALLDQGWAPQDRDAFLSSLESQYKAPFPPVGDETLAGGLSNTIAGRICNYFDFRGGGYTVDGACASSLLAVANACSALAAGDLDIALAGGVDLSLDPFELVGFAKVGALAKGEMRVYDARSAGFWPGEGCGLVVLMRAADALTQQRQIYALIRGWGISSDGSGGITRPEVEGQMLALERAYRRAGFGAHTVGYFEGHGTGTSVGDATELETILRTRQGSRHTPCAVATNDSESTSPASDCPPSAPATKAAIGSIKANIGHTKAAAGVAGLLKATLALHHRILPPSIGWDQPHPLLTADDASIRLLRRAQPWPSELPLRAAVSAMGFGGINAHLVLESAVPYLDGFASPRADAAGRSPAAPRQPSHQHSGSLPHHQIEQFSSSIQDSELFLFAAETTAALAAEVRQIASYADQLSFAELTDLAATLARSLGDGPTRAAVVASRPADLKRSLELLLDSIDRGRQQHLDVDRGVFLATANHEPSVGFLFPGQGTTASLDGGAWSARFPDVRQRYEQAALPRNGNAVATEIAHPAIMTATTAGLALCERLGIAATVGVGHSLGELAAYHWAGALDLPALMRLASARGQAIAQRGQAGGAMAGIGAPADVVHTLIGTSPVVVSGLNSPTQTIISGEAAAVSKVVDRAHNAGLQAVRLAVSHAFHSPLVADAVTALSPALDREPFAPLQRLVASTITGGFLDGSEILPDLLCQQMTSPVRLMSAIEAADLKVELWVEVGPGHVLRGIVGKIVDTPIVSLDAGGDSLRDLLRAVGAAFVLGAPVRVQSLFDDRFSRPFQLDWQAKFLVNPCELAPLPSHAGTGRRDAVSEPLVPVAARNGHAASPPTVTLSPHGDNAASPCRNGASALDVVRQLVAERAELPLDAVQPSDELLQDLHFSSIAVGSVVADAARALGLPPPVSPTDYARATVGEVAAALDELAQTGAAAAPTPDIAPAGVDTWVHSFTVELVEQTLSPQRAEPGPGAWHVVAPPDHPFAADLLAAMNERVPYAGVAVCLPADVDEQHVSLLLEATRNLLNADESSRFVLVLHSNVGGGWARTLHLEMPHVTTCVVNVPLGCASAVDWIVAEAAVADGYVEAHYDARGKRSVPVLRLLEDDAGESPPLGPADVLLVTGGGKGIAAECALDLAMQYGVRLALLGRSTAGTTAGPHTAAPDHQLDENLLRFTTSGVTFRYISADVTDAAAVQAAIDEIGRSLGPVTAVLHGAGGNVPQSLRTLDSLSVRATFAPKIDGLRNVLAAIDPERLRLLVTFGSIIARTGLHGEADYALANEWLTQLTENWRTDHPRCRCLAVEWSVWSGVGMGERLGRIDALRRQGITPISPDEGVRVLRRLIAATPSSSSRTAVVVSGRFGDPPTLRHEQPELPLLRFLEHPRLHVPGVELICDVALSLGADPYLRDHAYRDMPLLPAVVGLEAMAQISMALTGAATPPIFEQVELSRPVTVPAAENRMIRLAALVRAPGKVEVVLRSDETGFQADHFRAFSRFDNAPAARSAVKRTGPPAAATGPDLLALDPRRDLYGQILFHRGRFQRVEGYRQLSAKQCVAEISPHGQPRWFGGYLPETLLIGDPAMRDAAIHAIQACIPHGAILPVAIDRVVTAPIPLTGPCIVRAEEREHSGDRFVYDLTIESTDGMFRERWEGLRLQRVDTAAPTAFWALPLLAPYLERRLSELIPGTAASVAVSTHSLTPRPENGHHVLQESNGSDSPWHAERLRASNAALAAAVGQPVAVLRRPDGKPLVDQQRAVSVAHADSITLSIADRHRLVACDAEPLTQRDANAWNDLLLSEHVALARLIAEQSDTEDFSAAATRVWSARECLKKAGLRFDTPLVLRDTTPDHWAILAAGDATIATWVGAVDDVTQRLSVALLVGGAQ